MAKMMAVVVFLAGLAAAVLGGAIVKVSTSSIHEIEALICFLIAVCGLGLAGAILSFDRMSAIETELRALHKLAAEAGLRDLHKLTEAKRSA